MSEEDINERWLVVGTGHKKKSSLKQQLKPGEVDGKLLQRVVMGEKGIGRLAIAAIGKQLLLFSHRMDEEIVILFVDWRIFQHIDLNLDEIKLPIRIIDQNELPKKNLLIEMLNEFKDNFKNPKWKTGKDLRKTIIKDLRWLEKGIDINKIYDTPPFSGKRGTTFLIPSLEEEFLNINIGKSKNMSRIFENRLFRLLLGFRNTLVKNPIDMKYGFYVHRKGKPSFNVLDENEWWTKKDMENYDHLIEGKFNDYGNFNGYIEVFGNHFDYVNPWKRNKKTKCGPFTISLCYLEGEQRTSTLNKEEYNKINDKLDAIGGLYVYRDGIRVLPYGEPDVDFLEFEERRSRGAWRYFFSHRRFFGYIALSKNNNRNLRDKSSREGFIENAAYRDFTDVLKQFFIDLASDYFSRKKAKKSDIHYVLSQQHKAENQALKDEDKRTKEETKEFLQALKEREKAIGNGINKLKIVGVEGIAALKKIEKKTVQGYFSEVEEKIAGISEEFEYNKNEILDYFDLEKPERISLDEDIEGEYNEYLKEVTILNKEFQPIEKQFYNELENLLERLKDLIDKEKLLKKRIENADAQIQKNINLKLEGLNTEVNNVRDYINNSFKQYAEGVEPIVLDGKETLGKLIVKSDKKTIQKILKSIDKEGKETLKEIDTLHRNIIKNLKAISSEITDDKLIGAQKKVMEKQQEKLSLYHNLAQLGLAVEIIDHELGVLYQNIKFQLKELSRYRNMKDIGPIYDDIKFSFQHLESKHKLMLPLYRKSLLKKKTILGKDIYEYLVTFFEQNIGDEFKIKATKSFKSLSIPDTSETIIYPAFINLINNSIYWTEESSVREVHLDFRKGVIYIEDTGPGIPERDKTRIFEPFFSRKKGGGRGLGLYITKENLLANGFNIDFTLDPKEKTKPGACFRIYLQKGRRAQ
jgi:signal transduction histidine kinase